ncbi:MAG TPA: VOC family protein [Chthoniobacterales bacterium]
MTSSTSSFHPVIRRVALRTANAARLAEFYHQLLGLMPREESANRQNITLYHPVTWEILLTLIEEKNARPAPPDAPGLFHIAFLFTHLSDWRTVVRRAIPLAGDLHGASDHGVSWAVYLEDIDGNGLELAWDKPSHEWPWRGDQIQMVSRSLPLRCILLQEDHQRESVGTFSIGHLHLQVASLKEAEAYQTHLGLRVTQQNYPGALFLARDRYHHDLAINTWHTNPSASRPEHAIGLVGWGMTVDAASTASFWSDPSGSLVTLLPA